MAVTRKIQIAFTAREIGTLASLGPETTAAKVRAAIQFYDWCRRAMADGWTIAAVRGEQRREPVLPFPSADTEHGKAVR